MTATSGPGLDLMTEFLGHASMTETPVVIVDVQRSGPSTGMPTKTSQGDLWLAVYGGHDDFPRIVVAPLNVEDCFYAAVDAFNLAEKYQIPVILLSDFDLSNRVETIPPFEMSRAATARARRLATAGRQRGAISSLQGDAGRDLTDESPRHGWRFLHGGRSRTR